ncbi:hypothetical protein GWI33_018843 [Rhynchophorus ferrugineus]|uniref:Uncharacterized protein n=1 Tax=Rhynchophorus ferrugineus TaxID=354439 RepID=A0A834HSK8_RHYFE|nr:hypothetical protein GWI33_018843 [Rhynchophorus ferrugineus]
MHEPTTIPNSTESIDGKSTMSVNKDTISPQIKAMNNFGAINEVRCRSLCSKVMMTSLEPRPKPLSSFGIERKILEPVLLKQKGIGRFTFRKKKEREREKKTREREQKASTTEIMFL